jgi:hypothetical protein
MKDPSKSWVLPQQLSFRNVLSSLQGTESDGPGCSSKSPGIDDSGLKTGIEIYSVGLVDELQCEFIAPHSIEALLGSDKKPSVLYFAPSKCVCIHCLLSEARALGNDSSIGTSCLE